MLYLTRLYISVLEQKSPFSGYARRKNEAPSKINHGEMKQMTSETKQQLDWRRSKVLELSSQGYSEREIAEVLKVNDTCSEIWYI